MLKKLVIGALAVMLLCPLLGLLGVGVLMNPAANAACTTVSNDGAAVSEVPDELEATTADGEQITLTKTQLEHAATIIDTGAEIDGVGRAGQRVALMAALTESTLKNLANPAHPGSTDLPNDGTGTNRDSLGLFQMRPSAGWGDPSQLMNPEYQTKAFFGGPNGPNNGSPRGLLDISDWEQLDPGEAAQTVEASAYPDRYQTFEPVADTILETLVGSADTLAKVKPAAASVSTTASRESRVVFPLPADTWVITDEFGPRTHPVTGRTSMHTGADFAAPEGTPILAAADGTVTKAGPAAAFGQLIVIEHQINGATVATAYAHMWETGVRVSVGDKVRAGQHIGDVGSSGQSTGPHLQFEVRPGGTDAAAIDPVPWLNKHGAADLPGAEPGTPVPTPADCDASAPGPGDQDISDAECRHGSRVEQELQPATIKVYRAVCAAWPDEVTTYYGFAPRGEHATGHSLDIMISGRTGWDIAYWLQENHEELGIEYVIHAQKIWSVPRAAEGWRPMEDRGDPTQNHFDHVHVTTADD
ncbi:M23 family metallopeptidase [Aeromicrobium piscarium]|uniref:M23 family metallopeptidase n=1 Tax=Aeromicrobium piscarium TaxID=2590901 RepID=A0A554S7W7_9ACTN|nr:M23 family metallopeptidase [Aeromicrobium piscarium]TSD62431.1 M23 family metallopeptidase [Aeromicrobium piscarium]